MLALVSLKATQNHLNKYCYNVIKYCPNIHQINIVYTLPQSILPEHCHNSQSILPKISIAPNIVQINIARKLFKINIAPNIAPNIAQINIACHPSPKPQVVPRGCVPSSKGIPEQTRLLIPSKIFTWCCPQARYSQDVAPNQDIHKMLPPSKIFTWCCPQARYLQDISLNQGIYKKYLWVSAGGHNLKVLNVNFSDCCWFSKDISTTINVWENIWRTDY